MLNGCVLYQPVHPKRVKIDRPVFVLQRKRLQHAARYKVLILMVRHWVPRAKNTLMHKSVRYYPLVTSEGSRADSLAGAGGFLEMINGIRSRKSDALAYPRDMPNPLSVQRHK